MRLKSYAYIIPVAIAVAAATNPAFALKKNYTLDETRVNEIAASLSAQPSGPGRPASDRAFWEALISENFIKTSIERADQLRDKEIGPIPDDLYLEYSRNGNRSNYQQVATERRNRLAPLVLAECAKNTGEYMPAIHAVIKALCEDRTWVLPAHDRNHQNFNRTRVTIDLVSSFAGWELAIADYLLGDKLDDDVRSKLRAEVNRQVIKPYQDMIRDKRSNDRWFAYTNNWNPVCFAGCTGAGMILVESAEERAEMIAAAEYYQQFFLRGFTDDGYCSEGVAYWNYGYGRFAQMAENFREATNSAVDLFAMEGAAEPAAYGARISIINGVVPAFSDCPINSRPTPWLLQMLNEVYGWNHPGYSKATGVNVPSNSLVDAMLIHQWTESNRPPVKGVDVAGSSELRTTFDEAGIFILRPRDASKTPFAVSFKGGNNAELHNHNDVGAFTLVVGDQPLILDPGRENYTRRTFSAHRYESKLLNSYGHPVPVVGGALQSTGSQAMGRITHNDFSDNVDKVTMDITSAYEVPALTSLIRTFTYDRTNSGSLVITDTVEFSEATSFETALISLSEFQTDPSGSLSVTHNGQTVNGVIESSSPFTFSTDIIEEDAPVKPHRLAIKLIEPVTSATVTVRFRPGISSK